MYSPLPTVPAGRDPLSWWPSGHDARTHRRSPACSPTADFWAARTRAMLGRVLAASPAKGTKLRAEETADSDPTQVCRSAEQPPKSQLALKAAPLAVLRCSSTAEYRLAKAADEFATLSHDKQVRQMSKRRERLSQAATRSQARACTAYNVRSKGRLTWPRYCVKTTPPPTDCLSSHRGSHLIKSVV